MNTYNQSNKSWYQFRVAFCNLCVCYFPFLNYNIGHFLICENWVFEPKDLIVQNNFLMLPFTFRNDFLDKPILMYIYPPPTQGVVV